METKTKLSVTEGVTSENRNYIIVKGVYPLDIPETFDCGQAFRFSEAKNFDRELFGENTVYEGVAKDRYIMVSSPNLDTLIIEGANEAKFYEIWYKYFGLDTDYSAIIDGIREKWGEDSRLYTAADAGRGIRILSQDPWEALVSFIVSQNNNIPRIRGIIERLCENFGEGVPGVRGQFTFPEPRILYEADVDGIASVRMGFRAKYVFDAAERVTFDHGFMESVSCALDYETADKLLRTIKGVGPKVSACTLLFGFGRMEAFPVDVWIRRTVGKYFLDEEPTAIDFGELAPVAGVLQQYIFNYERNSN